MSNLTKKKGSTFDKEMESPKFKKAFEKSYKNFLLSELLLTMMEENSKSVRELAKAAHLSPTVIQNLRSNKQIDIKMKNFLNISRECGYKVVLEKGKQRILLNQGPLNLNHG